MILISKQNAIVLTNSLFCLTLMLIRVKITKDIDYMFLIWNLFLASIPYIMTQVLKQSHTLQNKILLLLPYLSIWLLFLPNAPYIITDLIHLNKLSGVLLWYDCFLIFLFACNGFILGILSITDVYGLISSKWNRKLAITGLLTVSPLCGFGVYLGRYLRWNSWEIFSNPNGLFIDIIASLKHPKAIMLSVLIGSLLILAFISSQYLFNKKETH